MCSLKKPCSQAFAAAVSSIAQYYLKTENEILKVFGMNYENFLGVSLLYNQIPITRDECFQLAKFHYGIAYCAYQLQSCVPVLHRRPLLLALSQRNTIESLCLVTKSHYIT